MPTTATLIFVYVFVCDLYRAEWNEGIEPCLARQVVKKRWRERASVENVMNMYENFILMRASSQLVPHTHTCAASICACHSTAAAAASSKR